MSIEHGQHLIDGLSDQQLIVGRPRIDTHTHTLDNRWTRVKNELWTNWHLRGGTHTHTAGHRQAREKQLGHGTGNYHHRHCVGEWNTGRPLPTVLDTGSGSLEPQPDYMATKNIANGSDAHSSCSALNAMHTNSMLSGGGSKWKWTRSLARLAGMKLAMANWRIETKVNASQSEW